MIQIYRRHRFFHINEEIHIGFVQRASGFFQIIKDGPERHCDLRQILVCVFTIYGVFFFDADAEGDEFVRPML